MNTFTLLSILYYTMDNTMDIKDLDATKNISERSEMVLQTAKKYLEQLYRKNIVGAGKYGNAVYWWLRT